MKLVFTVLGIFCVTTAIADFARADYGDITVSGGAIVEKKAEAPVKTKKKAKKSKDTKADDKKAKKETADAKPKKVTRDDGLVIEDLIVGSGMEAKEGSRVRVHYKGTFMNGKVFDSNTTEPNPEPFTLDINHLIAGWVAFGVSGGALFIQRFLLHHSALIDAASLL